jgi:hypothetical protein
MKNKKGLRSPTCTLSCPCGAPIIVDRGRPEGVQVCIVCHQSLKVVVTTEPRTRKRRIGIVVSPQALTTVTKAVKPASKREATRRRTRMAMPLAGAQNPKCACGAQVPVNLASVDAVYGCPWCGASYTAVARRDASTGTVTAVLMPVQAAPVEKGTSRKSAKSQGACPEQSRGAFHMTPDSIGAQALRTRDGMASISCTCGHELKLDPKTGQQERKCPGCGLSFQLVLAVEPVTGRAMVISLPRSKAAAKEMTA